MTLEEMRNLSPDAIAAQEGLLRKERFNLRFRKAMGEVENPMRLRAIRRELAQIKTIQNEKVRAVAKEGGGQGLERGLRVKG
ncbi:MAG: 50S ribosomal protein L29 [Nitrospirae bacterium]|nr:50S ribosomal protein L29 [Nitrospirota bacterium]MBI3393384.1 50S ribosomal protein L29 [Nitrospirota bacterium]